MTQHIIDTDARRASIDQERFQRLAGEELGAYVLPRSRRYARGMLPDAGTAADTAELLARARAAGLKLHRFKHTKPAGLVARQTAAKPPCQVACKRPSRKLQGVSSACRLNPT